MRFKSSICLVCHTLVLHLSAVGVASAQLQQLALRVPSTANALAVVNAEALHAHMNAVGDDWEGAGLTVPLEQVQWYLQAAEMDYEFFQPLWEVSVAAVPQAPTMDQIASASGGRSDRLAGSQTVERPNDSYVVAFGPKVLAAISPANRQNVARWIRESKVRKTSALSPFLANAVAVAEAGPAQIVIAFDLGGVLAPEEVSQALAKSPALTAAGVDPNQAAKLIGGIVGMRLDIQWESSFHGRLLIEFEEQPELLAKVAQPLLLEILAKRGAHVDALAKWTSRTSDKTIVLEGEMSSSGLRRIASILAGPVGPWSGTSTASSPTSTSPENVTGQVSKEYFQRVTGYLDDLFGGNVQPQSLYQVQVWVERYAHQIQELNKQGVDPDVLSYSGNVVMLLGEVGSSVQRAQMRSDLRSSFTDGAGTFRYGRYGTYGYFLTQGAQRDLAMVQGDELSQGMAATQQIVTELRQLSAQTRQAMTQRYGIEF